MAAGRGHFPEGGDTALALAVALPLPIVGPDTPGRKPRRQRPSAAALALLEAPHPHAAGIGAGAREPWVAFPPGGDLGPSPEGHPDGLPDHARRFGTFTADLQALLAAPRRAEVDTVATESTGACWVPLYDLLQSGGLRPLLADARRPADAPGRPKTDVKGRAWAQRLRGVGFLRAAFRPGEAVRAWRGHQRRRASLVADASRWVLRLRKAPEQMNVKLTEVTGDVTGAAGLAIARPSSPASATR